jgi:K+-sensing histidine kinase KdpD
VIDQDYIGFLTLAAGHVGAAIANARAHDEERRRGEALAEIDRAKTLFFSNVSHEFGTPLTLMMSPLEEMLAKPADEVLPGNRALIEVAHRNSLRLLKLVNSLLDFSRIEAGRAQATYEATDLANLTADLASNFRSACERAGPRLAIDCPPLAEPVHVDREMWEKIVLNLLSNAFAALDMLLHAGVRAVQSTPLISSTGNVLGVLSTHFAAPHRPSERDWRLIDILSQQTADYLERMRAEATMRQSEAWSPARKRRFRPPSTAHRLQTL